VTGNHNRGIQYKFTKMTAMPRVLSKPSTQSHSTRHSRQSRSSQDVSSATTMGVQDSAQPYFSFPSSLPHRHSTRDREITKWIAAKDKISYGDTTYSQGQLYLTDSDASFLINGIPTTSGVSWDNATPMGNLILDQCQPFLTNEPYQPSTSNGSSNSGPQSLFDPLAVDPSINLSTAPYLGSNTLGVGTTDLSFKNDFASGSISYDSSSSICMSPPVSPELQGQNWPGMPGDYGANGEYATHGTSSFVYPDLGGFWHQPSSPPSPPMSEGGPNATFPSVRQPLAGSQTSIGNSIPELGNGKPRSTQSRYRGGAVAGTLARLSSSIGQSSTQPSRPAQRILKPASEKPRGRDHGSQPVPLSAHIKPKEKPEAAQPRNHHFYKALPGKDGLFRCPFVRETRCAHPATKQKCGYE